MEKCVERPQIIGCSGDSFGERRAQDRLSVEQHFALVRELPEKGPFRDAGARRDLGGGGSIIPVLAEQLAQPAGGERASRPLLRPPCQSLTILLCQ